jgi:hypothetical protein
MFFPSKNHDRWGGNTGKFLELNLLPVIQLSNEINFIMGII